MVPDWHLNAVASDPDLVSDVRDGLDTINDGAADLQPPPIDDEAAAVVTKNSQELKGLEPADVRRALGQQFFGTGLTKLAR